LFFNDYIYKYINKKTKGVYIDV